MTIKTKEQTAADTLAEALEQGARAMPRNFRYNPATDTAAVDSRRSAVAGINSSLSLRDMLPDLIDEDGYLRSLTPATNTSERRTIQRAILANSRTVKFGANLIILPKETVASTAAGPILVERPSGLVNITPAPFSAVDDGESVPDSEMPTTAAMIDREAGKQYAFSTTLKRSEIKQRGYDVLARELLTSITAGVARAVDRHLLAAIAAANPGSFDLAAAAASGVQFADLRGLVGTNGSGATVDASGQLRAGGIAAELTSAAEGSFVADWSTTAVAVHDSIDLLINRTSASGSVTITCWMTLHALVAGTGMVWEVSA